MICRCPSLLQVGGVFLFQLSARTPPGLALLRTQQHQDSLCIQGPLIIIATSLTKRFALLILQVKWTRRAHHVRDPCFGILPLTCGRLGCMSSKVAHQTRGVSLAQAGRTIMSIRSDIYGLSWWYRRAAVRIGLQSHYNATSWFM